MCSGAARLSRSSGGKYPVCIRGSSQKFGHVDFENKTGLRKPAGIQVYADGRCVISEYAGGFDGFWSVDAGDGHEDEFADAVNKARPSAGVSLRLVACHALTMCAVFRR